MFRVTILTYCSLDILAETPPYEKVDDLQNNPVMRVMVQARGKYPWPRWMLYDGEDDSILHMDRVY